MERNQADLEDLIQERHRWRMTPTHLRSAVIPKCVLKMREQARSDPFLISRNVAQLLANSATPEDFEVQYKSTERASA